MTRTVRLLVADDHAPARAGVRAALEGHGFDVCAEVGNGADAVEAALRERPDVCLLDVHMPGNGIAAAARIADALPATAVVMLTISHDDADLFGALRAGACGYLLKDLNPDRLRHALRGALSGEAPVPRSLVTRVLEEFRGRSRRRRLPLVRHRHAQLTSREWEVLDLMGQGLSTGRIAKRLYVAPVTVRSHVSSILRKLDVPDRDAAVRLFRGGPDGPQPELRREPIGAQG